ncbi:hypothetical protein EDD37DRAFT_59641 [Exophiala viscosa]|uniref:Uncharacterized protein n=1 Tax=Exophiala viscosa TaxID=2486360 RepID=A0AAN6IIU8_9EURO|nr:hypothetical protein EDD36DRAFT_147763 [Exophiala viscosa]KAI1629588.1 hypothetical protein EDD37DRAFT_59641 [Exophiala viscosa]
MEKKHESKPYQGPFLFINSTAEKPTTSKNDSFTISSHVSKTHRNWLKAQRLKRLQASVGKAVAHRSILAADPIISEGGPLPLGSPYGVGSSSMTEPIQVRVNNDEVLAGSQTRYVLDSSKTGGFDCLLGIATSQRVFPFEASQERGDHQGLHEKSWIKHDRQAMRPLLAIWKGSADPFSAAAVHLTPRDHEIICLAQRFLVFAAWPEKASAVFRTPIADTTNSHIQLQQTITDEAEIHAILASGYHVAVDLSTEDSQVAVARRLAHKSRAVMLLRQKLSRSGSSKSVATLIRLLISLDFQAGDFTASLVHLRGLWSISLSVPGMLADTQELLIVSDVWIALSLLKRPEISPARYDPGPRLAQSFDVELRDLENHFPHSLSRCTTSSGTTVLDLSVLSLLNAASEIVNTKAVMAKLEDPGLQQDVVWWMHRRATAVSGRLMTGYVEAMEAAISPASDQVTTTRNMMNRIACLCAILFMNLRFVDSPSNYNFSTTFQAIEPALRSVARYMDDMPKEFDKAYLWTLFMCAMGNDVYAARGDILYSPWPVPEFFRVCKRMDLTERDAVINILSQFQYYPQMDEFLSEVLHGAQSIPVTNMIPWTRWCFALDHYIG